MARRQKGQWRVPAFLLLVLATIPCGAVVARAQQGANTTVSTCHEYRPTGIPPKGGIFYRMGTVHARSGDYAKAFVQYDRAIELNPGDPVYYVGRGITRFETRDAHRAIEDFDEAIRIDPRCEGAFIYRGMAYELKGEPDRASADYDRLISLLAQPGSAQSFRWRAAAYIRKKDYENALRDLDESLKRANNASALSSRCVVRLIVGTLDDAMADCNEALRSRPNPTYLERRGALHLKKGDLDAAIADYDAALSLDPNHSFARYGRGLARRLKGDTAGGNADVESGKAGRPGAVEAYARYGLKILP